MMTRLHRPLLLLALLSACKRADRAPDAAIAEAIPTPPKAADVGELPADAPDAVWTAFVTSFRTVINKKDRPGFNALLHPECVKCMTPASADFYNMMISFRDTVPALCTTATIERLKPGAALEIGSATEGTCLVRVQPIGAKEPLLLEGDFEYPVRPTHWVSMAYGTKVKQVQVRLERGTLKEVLPCPTPETLEKFRAQRANAAPKPPAAPPEPRRQKPIP